MGNCFSGGIEKESSTEKQPTVRKTGGGRVLGETETAKTVNPKEAAARAAESRYNNAMSQGGELSQKLNKENRKSVIQLRKVQAESNINSRRLASKLTYD